MLNNLKHKYGLTLENRARSDHALKEEIPSEHGLRDMSLNGSCSV